MEKGPGYLFLYSSLLLSITAMVMAYESIVWAHIPTSSYQTIPFIGVSTFTTYVGYWHLSHVQARAGTILLRVQRVLLIVGCGLCFITAQSLFGYIIPIVLLCLLGFLYASPLVTSNRMLQKILFFKSILLTSIWVLTTGLLPLWNDENGLLAWILLARFCFILAMCFLFDLRDLDWDKKQGRWNYLHHLSPQQVAMLYYLLLTLYLMSMTVLQWKGSSSIPFYWGYIPGILALGLFPLAKHTRHPYFFYGVVDGMMMLSGILLLLDGFK